MPNTKKITILHSNDMHGDFLAEKLDDRLVGGVSLLSGYINKVRAENKNVIYAVAGDMFRGSVIDSEFKGVSTIEIMNALSPDVVTIGNHEVDYGIGHLLFIEKCAKFPIINSNMYIKTNGSRLFRPYKVFKRGGMRILFIGIVTEQVLASAKSEGFIGTIIDTADAAEEVGKICNAHKSVDIDLTVLLTHIGIEEDRKLAAMLKPEWGVDIIIGGHSHTFMDKPEIVNGVQIVQAGTGTDGIGRFDVTVDTDNNCIYDSKWEFVAINEHNCERDLQLESLIGQLKSYTDAKYGKIVTKLRRVLTHPERTQETALGNLFADVCAQALGLDVMFLGSGSIRCEELGPIVTYGDLTTAYPYHDSIHMIKVTLDQLRDMLKYMCRDEVWQGGHTEFYQLSSAVRLTYSKSLKNFTEVFFEGESFEGDRIIKVGFQDYHFKNIEEFMNISMKEIEKNGDPKVVTVNSLDVICEYLQEHNILDSEVQGRLKVID